MCVFTPALHVLGRAQAQRRTNDGDHVFNNLSTRAARAVVQARREAGKRGAESLDVNSLVLGLIIEDQDPNSMEVERLHKDVKGSTEPAPKPPLLSLGPGRQVSRNAFFSHELAATLLVRLNEALPKSRGVPDTAPMPTSPEVHRVFDMANGFRQELHRSKIEPLELLAAALREPCEATRLLIEAGITEQQVLSNLPTEEAK